MKDKKYFCIEQNNSGGALIINDNLAEYLIIECDTEEDAYAYFNDKLDPDGDFSNSCPCCGPRWFCFGVTEYSQGQVNAAFASPRAKTVVHFKNGTITRNYNKESYAHAEGWVG